MVLGDPSLQLPGEAAGAAGPGGGDWSPPPAWRWALASLSLCPHSTAAEGGPEARWQARKACGWRGQFVRGPASLQSRAGTGPRQGTAGGRLRHVIHHGGGGEGRPGILGPRSCSEAGCSDMQEDHVAGRGNRSHLWPGGRVRAASSACSARPRSARAPLPARRAPPRPAERGLLQPGGSSSGLRRVWPLHSPSGRRQGPRAAQ